MTDPEPPSPSGLLREATRADHLRAEAAVLRRLDLGSRSSYRDYIARLAGFYEPVERLIHDSPAFQAVVPDADARRKLPWLREDLSYLDDGFHPVSSCRKLPRLDSADSVLGAAYVLEGATLGGKILLGRVAIRPALEPGRGATFFTGYGPRTSAMWQSFRAAIDARVRSDEQRAELVRGAAETFRAFERWIAPEPEAL